MLKISQSGNGFEVAISEPGTGWRGYKVYASDVPEVHNALDHYYANGVNRTKHTNDAVEDCPLCRLGRKERGKA